MKFLSVSFRCFGPFEEKQLDFTAPCGLHVIFGPNEAGKSSALRGLYALLFGFGHAKTDDFRFKTDQFRVQASLQTANGELLECIRRKGKKATLRGADDRSEIAESVLTQFLGGLQQSQFEQLFGLDSARLIEGGNLIALGKGDLGEALFAAGAGLAGLRKLAESLEERQAAMYKSRSSQLPINAALRDHSQQLAAVRDCSLTPEKYASAVAAALNKEQRASELRAERDRVRRELNLLERFQLSLSAIDLLQRARERRAAVAAAPRLPADFADKLHTAQTQRDIASGKLHELNLTRDALQQQQNAAAPSTQLLAEAAEIDELNKLVGADLKNRKDRIEADTRRREVEGEARDIYRKLTGTTDWERMADYQPREDEERRIQDLIAESGAVAERQTAALAQVRTLRVELVSAEEKASGFRELPDSSPLLAVIDSLTAQGPVEAEFHKLQTKLAAESQRLTSEFARQQPAAPGDWQAAPALPVPAVETVAEFQKRLDVAQRALDKLTAEREQLDHESSQWQSQLAADSNAQELPSLDELKEVREARDNGLHLLRQRLQGRPYELEEKRFTAHHAAGRQPIDATEMLVQQSDVIADRLRTDAQQVAERQALRQKLQVAHDRSAVVQNAQQAAAMVVSQVEREWQDLWQSAGITPQSPTAMQAWLTRWQRLCEAINIWQENQQTLYTAEQQINTLRTQLADACPAAKASQSLAAGIARARQIAKEASEQQLAFSKAQDDIGRLRMRLTEAETQLAAAEQRQATWKSEWAAAVSVLELKAAEVSVATAQIYLKRISEMQAHVVEARIKARRVKDLDDERAALLTRLTAVRQRINPAARPSTFETLDEDFRALDVALKEARVSLTRQQERTKRLDENQQQIQATTDSLRTAEAALHSLATLAEVKTTAELAAALQRSHERAAAEQAIEDRWIILADNARGQNVEQFIAAALLARATLETELEARRARAEQLDPEIKAAEAESLDANRELSAYQQATSAAADAKQRAELIAAELERQVVEYAALQLASRALEQAKERYRTRHQDTLLSRAGDFFRMLTDNKFQTLEIDNEEGDDVLKAIRAPGHMTQRVPVGGLSEGTRDQLFLALRLAGIEQHLQNREPVPLIIDDVLMTFDDDRCRSTLRCLAELSTKTQVLLFTHHRHVAELAQQVHPPTQVHFL